MTKLQIQDLLSELQPRQSEPIQSSSIAEEFMAVQQKKLQIVSSTKQRMLRREVSYRAAQQELDRWVGIVKLNREKETIDFTRKEADNAARINFFSSKPISDFQSKIDQQLNSLNLQSQRSVLKKEEEVLEKLDPQEAKRRLKEARKHRTLVFNDEAKRRRIAKIKSKLYRRIKKKQKMREEGKKLDGMNAEEKAEYAQKVAKIRIKERITLRHSAQSRHIQNLMRFRKGETQEVQDSLNTINSIRKKQLEKVEVVVGDVSEEYDEENYRTQAMRDLEREIECLEKEEPQRKSKGLDAMKFMQNAKKQEMDEERAEAISLLARLQDGNEMIDQDEEVVEQKVGGATRRVYGTKITVDYPQEGKRNHIESNLKQYANSDLTVGIDINRLKEKYQPNRTEATLTKENQSALLASMASQAAAINLVEFEADKFQDYEREIEPEQKVLKGWGKWTGPNIKDKYVDPQIQIRRKIAKIEEIKKKRRDGELSNVIINESYNKNLKDYFVHKLPHECAKADQFDFLQNRTLGPEWNSMTQFRDNIKPKVIVKAGQVIEPIRLPKKALIDE